MSDRSPFHGERVILRPFEPEDAPTLHAYLNHPGLEGRRSLPWGFPDVLPLSRQQAEGVIRRWGEAEHQANLAVICEQDGELIGHASMHWDWDPHCPEISVVIAPQRQRNGYGSEVVSLLLSYLFENTPAHVVQCWIGDWNEVGRQFARVCGFSEQGAMRRVGIREGQYVDAVAMDILRREWLERTKGG